MSDGGPPRGQPSGAFPTSSPQALGSSSRLSTSGQPDMRDASQQYPYSPAGGVPSNNPPPYLSQQQQQYYHGQQARANPQQPNVTLTQGPSPLNMSSIGAALPEVTYPSMYGQQHGQRFGPQPSTAPVLYPQQHSSMQYPQQFPTTYPAHQSQQNIHTATGSSHQFFPSQQYLAQTQQQQFPPYYYQQTQYPQGQAFAGATYASPFVNRMAAPGDNPVSGRQPTNEQVVLVTPQSASSLARAGSTASSVGQSSIPRGPPRKPKQSGHALWVGNLPPGANVVDLKDHFSRDATGEILSVFLISKSNCAFVNYKSEESCAAAMARFHDSRFQSVRLVCRLRRSSVQAASVVPTGPAALSASQAPSSKTPSADVGRKDEEESSEPGTGVSESATPKEKFFVVKSLTVEDLEMSVRNGIWATQSHNEETLNQAYKTTEAVYLIFSANKSGEYFGYARMTSAINDDPDAAIEFAPKAQIVDDPDLPKAIPTPATEFAPKGRIIDDSARGTIFWEAETGLIDDVGDVDETRSIASDHEVDDDSPSKAWGKPFKVEWLSTTRLPFYRTRGLRNPWNSNREVKIARDGTELETSIGRRLIQMFHREPSPVAPTMQPIPIPSMMGGYPQMRPFQ